MPVIDLNEGEREREYSNQQSAQRNSKSANHWWHDPITLFTAILAILRGTPIVGNDIQAWYMYRGIGATTIAAKAAEKSAGIGRNGYENYRAGLSVCRGNLAPLSPYDAN